MTPKIYHMHPLVAGKLADWPEHFSRCQKMGFNVVCIAPPFAPGGSGDIFATGDHETLHPALDWSGTADEGMARITRQAADHNLRIWLDLSIDRVASDAPLTRREAHWFAGDDHDPLPSPWQTPRHPSMAYASVNHTDVADAMARWWIERLGRLLQAGIAGFRCLEPADVPASLWRRIITPLQGNHCAFLAWTPGVPRAALPRLAGLGFDHVCSSLGWWDGRATWLAEEFALLRRIAPVAAAPEPSFYERRAARVAAPVSAASCRFALRLAAATGDGLFVPMGFEYAARNGYDAAIAAPEDFKRSRAGGSDLSDDIAAANALVDRIAGRRVTMGLRQLSSSHDPVTELVRYDAIDARTSSDAVLVLANPDLTNAARIERRISPLPPQAGAALIVTEPLDGAAMPRASLDTGEVRVLACTSTEPVAKPTTRDTTLDRHGLAARRIAIEAIDPTVPDGPFAVKRLVGDTVTVTADIFADGHDILSAELLWNTADEAGWHRVPMTLVENDRWEASFAPSRIGRYHFTVEAWWDAWATFCHDVHAKHAAGQVMTLEIEEGRRLLAAAAERAPARPHAVLKDVLTRLPALAPDEQVALLLAPETATAMHASDDRPFTAQHVPAVHLDVDRPQAAFASWYELFPRSATDDPTRHGTFADVIAQLPRIRDMGFDVLYFPPIHPIGTTNRKGRNNALRAGPDDTGSPYAIGGPEGGHDALHPQLGTFDDFRSLIDAARDHGLEIAIDFAIQCSPDHPWIREHHDWFRWRPDGSMRYAENPPKKYEDIVNPDFFAETAVPSLWLALRDVILFWCDHGIRIFRVDNPHTKPLPFWHWMIAEVRARHPDALFLAEAFTRPKMMYRLAKVGFTQSYTYFTWRHTKHELTAYLTELTAAPARECFRPNFFVNTPDINPPFLQTSGRPGFLIRAALACTLSGLWGMYSGFEICESAPLPGREEYLDSEKYQIRVRDFAATGNIVEEITALNRIRRAHPALQSHLGITFYPAFNDQILFFGKRIAGGHDMILAAVSLDPYSVQEASVEIPLWEWGLPDHGAVGVTDLMRGHQFVWNGKQQRIRLDPNALPFAIWQIAPVGAP
jgi:starch synthase (maltosyl-transferring)